MRILELGVGTPVGIKYCIHTTEIKFQQPDQMRKLHSKNFCNLPQPAATRRTINSR